MAVLDVWHMHVDVDLQIGWVMPLTTLKVVSLVTLDNYGLWNLLMHLLIYMIYFPISGIYAVWYFEYSIAVSISCSFCAMIKLHSCNSSIWNCTMQDAYRLQLKLFLYEVKQQQLLASVRTFLKVYSTISLGKLATYMEVDEATLRWEFVNV